MSVSETGKIKNIGAVLNVRCTITGGELALKQSHMIQK